MSKPVAKKAAPKAVAKAPAGKPGKTLAGAAHKSVAKKSTVQKPAVKPAAKAAAKSTSKSPAKPAAKLAATPAPRPKAAGALAKRSAPPAAPLATKPTTRLMSQPTSKPTPKPAVTANQLKTNPIAKSTSKSETHRPSSAPTPVAAPITNRFTDRFAPARPMKMTEHEPMEVVKSTVKVDPKVANAWKTKPGRELSVAELVAMPDDQYMNDKQLDFFRALLRIQRDDLLSNAGETTEHLREDTTITPDPADRATIEEEHALELRTRDRERKLLKKIAQSLTRVDSGEYGYCDETGEPIGLARLMARPTATLSLEAQQRREMKQKMFGD